jgi:nitroreductase
MNETLMNILGRRSIRKYLDKPVDKAIVDMVLAAGCAAPSACNVRPVRFIVIDKDGMNKLAENLEEKTPFREGQWAIAVCGDTRGYALNLAWLEDCAAAMENMQIACKSLGLGSLWFGVYHRPEKEKAVRVFLEVPDGIEVLGIIIMGYTNVVKPSYSGVDKAKVCYGKWSE